jgi:RNA polymerase sigma factor (sigma-70 family)
VQETFVHVWENHKTLGRAHDQPIHFYLARVVKNKSISWYKKSLRLHENHTLYLNGNSVGSAEQSIETQLIDEEISARLKEVINTFPKREKECLLMKVNEAMSTREIATALGVTPKAVERSITSANKRLRQWAKKEW